ncbi:MAG: HIT family protein [Betaproteobacteria bacterium]|nr:HIT family protein [Betaproteobacteria bacterium]
MTTKAGCEFCDGDGGEVLFRADRFRVVAVPGDEAKLYPGFCRVIWNAHVKEVTDLMSPDRDTFMAAVYRLEGVLRNTLSPVKMNLASLGNMTPHLHWHVIPRYADDAAYPKPVWALSSSQAQAATISLPHRPADSIDWRAAVRTAFAAS